MSGWKLEDVESVNKENPNTFFISSLKERSSQKKGDLVRLHFLLTNPKDGEPRAERMWVEILRKKMFSKKYIGILTNIPVYIKDLNIGDEIEFEPKHIARTFIKKEDSRWLEIEEKKALVSKKCMEDNVTICWLYREKADKVEDSGWRMFSGDEDEEYTNNPDNIRVISVGYLLDKDPTLLEIVKSEIGSAYERENKDASWKKVEDWYNLEE
ncbi:DUF2185 domain-containing protein [Clostridium beijerinckii]|uniref:DUF2185 domain-containing protein n=1 Tax=Clostridium beijerinckii TaxID=1520 RepID=UPI00232A893E|nr:DUF2185 domain-containing protein [Clostridium beijerinckii]